MKKKRAVLYFRRESLLFLLAREEVKVSLLSRRFSDMQKMNRATPDGSVKATIDFSALKQEEEAKLKLADCKAKVESLEYAISLIDKKLEKLKKA